jgi:hypothetical protein
MTTWASKPSVGVRIDEKQQRAVPGTGIGGEANAMGSGQTAPRRPAEATLRDQFAELRALGLACDRW